MTRRPRPGRGTLAGAVALLLSASLAACGSDGDTEPDADASGTPAGASSTGATDATDDPTATTDYLPVPAGVELAEPGTEVAVGQHQVAAWMPRRDLVGVVDVVVTSLETGKVARLLGGYELDDATRASKPYLVRTTTENVGDTDLGGRQLPFYLLDDQGRLVEPTGIVDDFAPCPDPLLPAVFAPGDTAKGCLVFLVPDGAKIDDVMFRPPEGVVPIMWSGRVERYRASDGDGGAKKGGKKNRQQDRQQNRQQDDAPATDTPTEDPT